MFTGAREKEHKMAVQAAIALKTEQDKELAKQHAARAATARLELREQVLATTREENNRLKAEQDHARQAAHQ
jgi:hypothetical protein